MVEEDQIRIMANGSLVKVVEIHRDEPVPSGSTYRVTLRLIGRRLGQTSAIDWAGEPTLTFDRRYATVSTYPLY